MELSPDLARRGISPINDSLIEASRSVLVSHQPAAAPSSPAAAGEETAGGLPSDFAERARSDLRSMSQRLERLLRERREAVERARFRLRTRHQQHEEEEEEELESEEVLAPPAGLPGLGPAAEEGFHVTLGRNRSDIERWFFLVFFRVVDPH
jgi:hypothetical protein